MPAVDVLDSHMHYEESGEGAPFVFLHGNPASSHLWRGVLPGVARPGRRLLAPDLIGMGRSGKPDVPYRFGDHARYLDAWFDALGLEYVVLVGHDWGGALAFDWAARHPGRVRGVAFMEAIVRGMSLDELGDGPRARTELIRGPKGESLVLDGNFLVETAFTGGVLTPLGEREMQPYLALPDPREPPAAAGVGTLAAARRRARRRGGLRRGVREVAGEQRRRAEAAAHLRLLADADDRRGDGGLVRTEHRRPGDRALRPSGPPRPRGPSRGHRRRPRLLGRQTRAVEPRTGRFRSRCVSARPVGR
ncbi:haloalkane dehalogenase [Nonomuraea terrae]|uniref:haloalkane dehalogenase n=1 Tax=Nonomuraea terrae TaxID=2530383 RepID=UPI00379AB640